MRKFKTMIPIVAAMLIVALLAVACSPDKVNENNETISLYFGQLQAKAIDDNYTVSGTATWGSTKVQSGSADDFYWSYTAVKGDSNATVGEQKTAVACAEGKGLGSAREFSTGKWTFTLYAYATAADRTAATNNIYEGSVTNTYSTSDAVAVPVTHSGASGNGTTSFTITTNLTQATVSGVSTKYKVTGVEAIVGDETVTLSSTDNVTWTGSASSVASGTQTIGLKVYVDSESSPRASNDNLGTAMVMYGLTTEVKADVNIDLTQKTISLGFNMNVPTYQIGEFGPAGGIVFYDAGSEQTSSYVDENGKTVEYKWRYLEAAPADVSSSAVFGYYRETANGENKVVVSADTSNDGEGNTAIGQGRYNTTMLVYKMGTSAYTLSDTTDNTTTDTYAAKLCDDYTYGGYDDWFLPSIEELRYMYENLKAKSIGTWSNYYWSSSEFSASSAWYYAFGGGRAKGGARGGEFWVRAVRAFL